MPAPSPTCLHSHPPTIHSAARSEAPEPRCPMSAALIHTCGPCGRSSGARQSPTERLTRGQLRWNYTAIHPDVYVAKDSPRDSIENAYAAWLWTAPTEASSRARPRQPYYGVSDRGRLGSPIELIGRQGRRRPGIIVRNERIGRDEVRTIAGMPVTSPARTALDLARHLPRDDAVVLLDQLAAVTGVEYRAGRRVDGSLPRGTRHPAGQRWRSTLMDGGTRVPRRHDLRLALHDAGLPAPRTSIVLRDGLDEAVIGMGWDEAKVGVSRVTPRRRLLDPTNPTPRTGAAAGVVRDPGLGRRSRRGRSCSSPRSLAAASTR